MTVAVPSLAGFDHVHVLVPDRVRAEAWFRDVLGMTRVRALEAWAGGGGPLMVRDGSGAAMLALFEGEPGASRSTVAFRVDAAGFRDWRAHLAGAIGDGVRFSDHGAAVSLYFDDPFGNPFEITCYEVDAVEIRR